MRKIGFVILCLIAFSWANAQNLRPYILGVETNGSVSEVTNIVKTNLENSGIDVVGNYTPANDYNRRILVITSFELKSAIKKTGGLTGFAVTQRVAITKENDKVLISYTNPPYWGNAYFRDSYPNVASNYNTLVAKLKEAMIATGEFVGTPFGSKKGHSVSKLRNYHYMLGMPRFDNTKELATFDNYQAAIDKIEASIKNGTPNVKKV